MSQTETKGSNIYVYVAGPYTNGNKDSNVRLAIIAAEEIAKHGFIPFVPHLYHYWDKQVGHGYDHWMNLCLAWLDRCDCVFRIYGYSPGASEEVDRARKDGKPIFYLVEKIVEHYNGV